MTRCKRDTDEEYRAKKSVIAKRYRTKQGHRTDRWDRTPHERFWSMVDKDGPLPVGRPELGPCHIWIGAKNEYGYGIFNAGGRIVKVHRWVSEQAGGPIPARVEVMHECDNPPCVRLSHLHRGSHAENMAEMAQRKRWGGPRNLPRGDNWRRLHPEDRRWGVGREWTGMRGEQHPGHKLTESQVRAIRSLVESGTMSMRSIGRQFGVSNVSVKNIATRKTWRHV